MGDLHTRNDDPDAIARTSSMAESLAFKSRFVLLFGEIDHATARAACERLIALAQDSDAPITVSLAPTRTLRTGDSSRSPVKYSPAADSVS